MKRAMRTASALFCKLTASALFAASLFVSAPASALGEDLQCVPYARQLSGIQIYGDALTWWGKAEGRYARGHQPKVGAVLAFQPHGNMRLGHVAAVSKIVDSRTLLISHSNWSTIDGTRGHIENNVKAVDVSPGNDWSRVRVWYTPIGALGGTRWPTYGFIYSDGPPKMPVMLARGDTRPKASPGRSRNLLSQIDTGWVEKAAAREQEQAARRAMPTRTKPASRPKPTGARVASAALPVGYTPSTYARADGRAPGNLNELLARY